MSGSDTGGADLGVFFHPSSVVVVGASDTEGRPSTINWRLIRSWAERERAEIIPVNPNRSSVDGVDTVPTVRDLTSPPDVVAVLVSDVEPVVRDAVSVGARFVLVFAAGYAEVGPEGVAAQQALVDIVAGTPTRLIGPNTNLNAFEEFRQDLSGPAIAIISQSGHQGRPLFMAQQNGVRVAYWAPTGNEADIESADFIEWFAERDEVGCIAAYIEGFADPQRFIQAARRATDLRTPLVVVKVGRSAAGREAASSHTGKLAGADRITDAVLEQCRVVRVDTLDELSDTAQTFVRGGTPIGDGVAVYSISGGTNAHAADLCAVAGLRLATLGASTIEGLREHIPGYLNVNNPIDCGGHPVGDERGRSILDTIISDPDVGVLLCVIAGPFPPLSDRLASDLVAVAEQTDKLVAVVWGSPVGTEPALRETLLNSSQLVVYRSLGNCTRAVAAWLRWYRRIDLRDVTDERPVPALDPIGVDLSQCSGALDDESVQQLLGAVGIPTPVTEIVSSADEAVEAALRIGGAVVLKVSSPQIAHRSDLGLVRVGVEGDRAIHEVATDILQRAVEHLGDDSAQLIVAEQVTDGVELIVGAVRDGEFGLVLMVGLGGVHVEVLDDTVFRVPPIGPTEVESMLDELRGAALLHGVRGQSPVDREAVVNAVLAVQDLAVALGPSLRSLELNPLVVRRIGTQEADGRTGIGDRRVVALDALIEMVVVKTADQ